MLPPRQIRLWPSWPQLSYYTTCIAGLGRDGQAAQDAAGLARASRTALFTPQRGSRMLAMRRAIE
jgi:hypothetical protein